MVSLKLKKCHRSIVALLTLVISTTCYGAQKYSDYRFADVPFEYATLVGVNIKPNIIFLVDNSAVSVPLVSENIIRKLLKNDDLVKDTRMGLAYLYADSHPFIGTEIPTRFIGCVLINSVFKIPVVIARIGQFGVEAIPLVIAMTQALIPTPASPIQIPAALASAGILLTRVASLVWDIGEKLINVANICKDELKNTDLNLHINTHHFTKEVPLRDSSSNKTDMLDAISALRHIPSMILTPVKGLPIITRRYYEITHEIRKSESFNSFVDKSRNTNQGVVGNIRHRINNIKNFFSSIKIPIFNIPIHIPIIGLPLTLLDDLVNIVGPIPKYEPLFANAIEYRCQPTYVVVLSPAITAPAIVSFLTDPVNKITTMLNKLFEAAGVLADPYILLPDLNKLKINENDDLVRNYTYKISNKRGDTLTFKKWNNPVAHYGKYGLAFLSTLFNTADLKTYLNNGADNEGKSWDEEDYPLQNITTITVNTGIIQGKKDNGYLKYAASDLPSIGKKGYFKGESDIIDSIKEVIQHTSFNANGSETIAPTGSTVLSSTKPSLGVSAVVNTKNWSSTLRFYGLTKKDDYFTANLDNPNTPRFPDNRVVIVSTKDKAPYISKGDTAFERWLLRPNNESDTAINRRFNENLRVRCPGNENNERCESSMLGDILDSPIVAIDDNPRRNRSSDPYATFMVAAANDGMVHIFKKTNHDEQPYELVLDYLPASATRNKWGTWNKKCDQKNKKEKNGCEQNKYTNIWEQLPNLAHPAYGHHKDHPHQFFLNGGIAHMGTTEKTCTGRDTCQSDPAKVFMVGSYGQGGRGLYALILGGVDHNTRQYVALSRNNKDDWVKEIPLWESGSNQYGSNQYDQKSQEAHAELGYIVGSPVLAKVALNRIRNNELNQMKPRNNGAINYAVFTGNGFFSATQQPTLYVFNALGVNEYIGLKSDGSKNVTSEERSKDRGRLIAKITTKDKPTGNPQNGLSAPTVVDVDGDGIADIAYAGDYEGNLYRFDLRAENPNHWTSDKIFLGTSNQPITTAPVVYQLDRTGFNYVVMFGTGSDVFTDDILNNNKQKLNTNQQAIYGIYDDLRQPVKSPARKKDLLQQTIKKNSGSFRDNDKTILQVSNEKIEEGKHKGWYINLINDMGERVTRPGVVTANSVFFTTRIYKENSNNNKTNIHPNHCSNPLASKSYGYLLGLNPHNGGNLSRNSVNLNPSADRGNKDAEFISGFQLSGVPSALSFVPINKHSITNQAGQFDNGWEYLGELSVKQYDEGSLVLTTHAKEYYVLPVAEPHYIKVRRLNSREVF